jgi:glycosyltransferase involved in cell wall biosynthesis
MSKVRYVGHGIHKERSSGIPGFKEKYGIKNRMFLSSGGFWTHKGMQNLVDIFEAANVPDTTLVLTGYYMGDRAETLSFDPERVRALLLPDRKEVLSAMLESDLYILNSYKEGFGLVLLESMLNGVPWASRNTPGALDMTDFGFVYEKDEELLEYLKAYKKPDASVGINEILNNRLIKNTVDDILNVVKK